MKVPPEIDELMWQIAESDNPQAFEEFEQRYPEFLPEMAKRVNMVRGLKGSRPPHAPKRRERFMPSRQVAPAPPIPAWTAVLVALALVSGVAFATFGVIRFVDSRQANQSPPSGRQPLPQNQTPNQDPALSQTPPYRPDPQALPPNPTQSHPVVTPESPFDVPVTVVASQISLRAALYDIATQAGVELELAPNFPEFEIAIDYRSVPAQEVLKDMGRNFSFSFFEQGFRRALLIPAVDHRYTDSPGSSPGISQPAEPKPRDGDGSVVELTGR